MNDACCLDSAKSVFPLGSSAWVLRCAPSLRRGNLLPHLPDARLFSGSLRSAHYWAREIKISAPCGLLPPDQVRPFVTHKTTGRREVNSRAYRNGAIQPFRKDPGATGAHRSTRRSRWITSAQQGHRCAVAEGKGSFIPSCLAWCLLLGRSATRLDVALPLRAVFHEAARSARSRNG